MRAKVNQDLDYILKNTQVYFRKNNKLHLNINEKKVNYFTL